MFYMVASNMNGLLGVRLRSGDTTLVRVEAHLADPIWLC